MNGDAGEPADSNYLLDSFHHFSLCRKKSLASTSNVLKEKRNKPSGKKKKHVWLDFKNQLKCQNG